MIIIYLFNNLHLFVCLFGFLISVKTLPLMSFLEIQRRLDLIGYNFIKYILWPGSR